MKRPLPILLAFLMLSCAQAQSSYVGFQLSGIISSSGAAPFAELQVGGPVADHVELRVSGLPLVLVNVLQADLLYTEQLTEALRGYAGGGADVLLVAFTEGVSFAVHTTAGVESQLGSGIGLFAELQPIYLLNAPYTGFGSFFGKLATGVNVHF